MEWIRIFSSRQALDEQLPEGKPRLLKVAEQSICLVKWKGELFAVENNCPHNGESLSKGNVNYLGELICPWHGYRFHLGTGREGHERCRDAETFPIKENDEGVFVGL